MTLDARLAVVGLGLMGAAAVRHAATAGVDVVGIGPREPDDRSGHDGPFASHYDSGRITRILDGSPLWSELARRSIQVYPELARRSGVDFHRPVGVLWVSTHPDGLMALRPVGESMSVDTTVAAFADRGIEHLAFGAGDPTVLEPDPAGHIDPREMLRAQKTVAVEDGAVLLDDVVESIEPDASGVTLVTRTGELVRCETVIVAAGAYTGFLAAGVDEVPIVPTTEAVVLGEISEATSGRLTGLPSVIRQSDAGGFVDVYLVPPIRYPDGRWYVKLGAETEHDVTVDDPEAVRRWMAGDEAATRRDILVECLTGMLPDVDFVGFAVEPCIYARTPTLLPYVDHLDQRVVVAAGGNGRAAKSADAIGSLATRLALTGDWDDPLPSAPFSFL